MTCSLSVLIVRNGTTVLRGEMFLVVRFHIVKNKLKTPIPKSVPVDVI